MPAAFSAYDELFDEVLGWERPMWLAEARQRWCQPVPPVSLRVAVPIWRDPWMVVGARTFCGDLLRRLGWENIFAGHAERYPHVDRADIDAAGADLVILPDEPYPFAADDGPEAFSLTPARLVSPRSA